MTSFLPIDTLIDSAYTCATISWFQFLCKRRKLEAQKGWEGDGKVETVSRTSAKQHYAANTTLAVYKHLHRQYANAKLDKDPKCLLTAAQQPDP